MPDDLSTKNNNLPQLGCGSAMIGMAIMRVGLGAMFLDVFFENLSKGSVRERWIQRPKKGSRSRPLEKHYEFGGESRNHCWSVAGSYRD